MAPHQAAYGAFGVPLNLIIASVTLTAYVVSGEAAKFRFEPVTVLLIAFAGWLGLSQLFSLDPEYSAPYFDRFLKTLIFVILCAQMATDKLRFHALVWAIVLCLGFFAVKGALFTFATFGEHRVQGLENTILEDNNHFGIAIASILPLIAYLRGQAARPWLRWALLGVLGLSIVSVIGTHSRGAFIALVVFAACYWLRANRKIAILAGLALLLAPTIAFMPSKWTERMSTIGEAAKDESFMGRIDAWVINYKLAKDHPLTGAGMRNSYKKDIAMDVDPKRAQGAKAAHSIYFEVLGGAGFVGLAIYLSLFAAAWISAWRVYLARHIPTLAPWKSKFAFHAQISLIVFAVGGASTSMEMWDGYLMIIALVGALTMMASREMRRPGYALAAIRGRNWRRKKRLEAITNVA
jgi:probable O-glycosylation ligase (exosortase A-associated)